jgi:circadian clock protein KaiC
MTSHVRPGTPGLSEYGIEEFMVSGVISLRLVKPEKKYVRSLFVRKMRGTATDLSEYAFEIVQGRGIVIRQPI